MHDSWARYYDFVYDECFGPAFWRLTAETLALISDVQAAPARVLDLGAGTGRLALPLALLGYDVTAVERSPAMADILGRRAADLGVGVDLRRADFRALATVLPHGGERAAGPYDLAVAIFTVLNYLVSDADLARLAHGLAQSVRPGGHFIFDVAARRLFASALFESANLHREVEVHEVSPRVFSYRDAASGTLDGQRFHYDEVFTFRYWRDADVLGPLEEAGFILEAEMTGRLRESGSRWFVVRRVAQGAAVRAGGPGPID
jgi:SAM-dependent methyltransferase